MNDLQRLLAFLSEMETPFPHEVVEKPEVMTLPMDPGEINFIRYASKVSTDFFVCYFKESGEFAGIARPGTWADQ